MWALCVSSRGQSSTQVNHLPLQVDYHQNGSGVLTGWGSENDMSTAALLAAFFEFYAYVIPPLLCITPLVGGFLYFIVRGENCSPRDGCHVPRTLFTPSTLTNEP